MLRRLPNPQTGGQTVLALLRLARREVAILATILFIALALLGFSEIADEVVEGETGAFDEAVMLALRDPADHADPLGPAWVEKMARDITALGGHTVLFLVSLLVVGYQLILGHRRAALLVAVSVGGGALLSTLLKNLFGRPRPDLVPHGVEVVTLSFPSGHAMLSAVTYLTLGALLMRVQPQRRAKAYFLTVAVGLALLIGASRVYLGVHFPTDVLAGWCIGAAWAMLCWAAALWLQRRGKMAAGPTD